MSPYRWQDTIYSPEKAKAAFAKAKEELQGKGLPSNPFGYPVEQTDVIAVQQTNSLKQSIESSLGTENVIVDVLQMTDNEKWALHLKPRFHPKRLWLERNWLGPDYQDRLPTSNILDARRVLPLNTLGINRGKDPSDGSSWTGRIQETLGWRCSWNQRPISVMKIC